MTIRHYDTVVRVRAPRISGDYNATIYDWPNASRDTFPATVQPLSSSEDVVAQQRTETRWRVFTAPTAGFLATDRVEWADGTAGSDTFDIDGDVEMHKRRGVPHHIELVLKRVQQE